MGFQNWVSLLNPDAYPSGSGAGTSLTLAASTQQASPTLNTGIDVAQVNPFGQYLGWRPNMLIRITARGLYTSTATTGTLTPLVRLNKGNPSTAAYTTVVSGAGITTPSAAITVQWWMHCLLRCTAIASSGNTVSGQGEFCIPNNATAPTMNVAAGSLASSVVLQSSMGTSGAETAAAIDTTLVQGIGFAVTGTAAQGTFQVTQWLVEALN